MNTVPDMVCKHCKEPVNQRTDLDTGEADWLHGRAVTYEHEATPVPRDQVADAVQFCDFCDSTTVAWIYHTRGEISQTLATPNYTGKTEHKRMAKHWEAVTPEQAPATDLAQNVYADRWTACVACAKYIELRDMERLITHLRRTSEVFASVTRTYLRQHFSEFFCRVGRREAAVTGATGGGTATETEEGPLSDRDDAS